MNATRGATPAQAPQPHRWVVVSVGSALGLEALAGAAAALGPGRRVPARTASELVSAALRRLEASDPPKRRPPATLRAEMTRAARALLALGPVHVVCPSLPWAPDSDTPPAPVLALAGTPGLRVVPHLPGESVEAAAVALLAELGAFARVLPPAVQLQAAAAAPGPAPGLHLLLLQRAADGAAEADARLALPQALVSGLHDANPQFDAVVVLSFIVDDQTPEDLAIGLDRIRRIAGVLDVASGLVTGKKGRLGFRVEVLVRPEQAAQAVRGCLLETTTIGLRWQLVDRVTLQRQALERTAADGRSGSVKRVLRPGGQYTDKVEADVLADAGLDRAGRQRLRAALESAKR